MLVSTALRRQHAPFLRAVQLSQLLKPSNLPISATPFPPVISCQTMQVMHMCSVNREKLGWAA